MFVGGGFKLNRHRKGWAGFVIEKMVVVGMKDEGGSRRGVNDPVLSRSNPESNIVGRVGVDVAGRVITR